MIPLAGHLKFARDILQLGENVDEFLEFAGMPFERGIGYVLGVGNKGIEDQLVGRNELLLDCLPVIVEYFLVWQPLDGHFGRQGAQVTTYLTNEPLHFVQVVS